VKEASPYIVGPVTAVPGSARETPYLVLGEDDFARVDLWQYWRVIRKHLWLALAVPLAFVLLTATHDLMATRQYTARTTILIKNNAPQEYEYTSMDNASGAAGAAATQWNVNNKTEYTLLESRNLANRVIIAEGLFANPIFAGVHHPSGGPDEGGAGAPGDDMRAGDGFDAQSPAWLISRYLADLKSRRSRIPNLSR
jgi:Chain length determinant protein